MAPFEDLQAELTIVSTSQTKHLILWARAWYEQDWLCRGERIEKKKRRAKKISNKKNDHTHDNSMIQNIIEICAFLVFRSWVSCNMATLLMRRRGGVLWIIILKSIHKDTKENIRGSF